MVESFMGSVGPDDDDGIPLSQFIPKQAASPEAEILQKIASPRRLTNALDVMRNDTKLSYIVQDILPESGLIYFGGLSGTGKTILAIQFVADIINGRPCMTWRLGDAATDDMKAIIFSLEMNELELGERLRHMYPKMTDDEEKIFLDKFIVYSEPDPFKLWETGHQLEFMQTVRASGAQIQIIDSASVSFGEEMNNQVQVNKSLDFLRMCRAKYNWAQIIVCHTRKPPAGIASNPADVTLNELFGHSGVAQSASSIVIMMEDEASRKDVIKRGLNPKDVEKKVHIVNCKARFGANGGAFISHLTAQNAVDRGEPLMFRRNAIPIELTDEQRQSLRSAKPKMKDIMGDIDFGSLTDGDE